MPGPAPKPEGQRRRRNPTVSMTRLPAEGRKGDALPWPLPGRLNAAERAVWAELWGTPQAKAWEQLGWTRTVARYCRSLVAAEKREAPVMVLAEVRQLEDRLGLTPMSMLRLRWEITVDELAEERQQADTPRERLRAVE